MMDQALHAFACMSIHAITCEQRNLRRAKFSPMSGVWLDRLQEAVDADGRSLRALSMAAGHGPNFLSQLLKDRKEPGIGKILSLLDTMGAGVTIYVLTGLRFDKEDEDFVRLVLALPPELRAEAKNFFRALQRHEGIQGQQAEPAA